MEGPCADSHPLHPLSRAVNCCMARLSSFGTFLSVFLSRFAGTIMRMPCTSSVCVCVCVCVQNVLQLRMNVSIDPTDECCFVQSCRSWRGGTGQRLNASGRDRPGSTAKRIPRRPEKLTARFLETAEHQAEQRQSANATTGKPCQVNERVLPVSVYAHRISCFLILQ